MWENKGIKLVRDHYIMTHPERGKLTFLIWRREILYQDPVMTSLPQTLCFLYIYSSLTIDMDTVLTVVCFRLSLHTA